MIQDIYPSEFHFAGHETFHLRYTWLPKAADYLKKNSDGVSLSKYDIIMTELGIGKSMARSLRHWAESSQLFQKDSVTHIHDFTDMGKHIFSDDVGLDPYLEMPDTNWLLHYLITSNHKKNGLWFYLFNVFNEQIIIKDEFLFSATNWFKDQGVEVNPRTLERDFQCCINMYDSSKLTTNKARESILLSPFRELKLVKKVGENYRLRSLVNKEISPAMFAYCLLDYLRNEGDQNSTPLSELLNGIKSPGRIFRLTEPTLIDYLKEIKKFTKGYSFDNTAGMQQLIKKSQNRLNKFLVLKKVYAV